MTEGDACLLDTNILLRISTRDDPHHPVIIEALKTLVEPGVRSCYTSQTLAEFWNTSTDRRDKIGVTDGT
jgi:predicted nucleic acid-binding protein